MTTPEPKKPPKKPAKKPAAHDTCCKHIKRPKTADALADLNYPSAEPKGGSHANRAQNPDQKNWPFKTNHEERGWWFPVKPGTQLLDGTNDCESRGTVVGYALAGQHHRTPGGKKKYWAVCLNAASIKALRCGKDKKERACAMTFSVALLAPGEHAPEKLAEKTAKGLPRASGWIPLDDLELTKAFRDKTEANLRNFRCCAEKYGTWGQLIFGKHATVHRFRTLQSLLNEYEGMLIGKVPISTYFKEKTSDAIKKALQAASIAHKKSANPFYDSLYINKNASAGRFGDYLARPGDKKAGKYPGMNGYTYISANLSKAGADGKGGAAPIAIDVLPANYPFHRLGNREVLAPVFDVNGRILGTARWWYGWSVKQNGKESDRSYGWVPRLAVM